MSVLETRARLADAAFELCRTASFESVTVDQIAAKAGVSRMTFFRHFRTKEDVVFPDHDSLLSDLEAELSRTHREALDGVCQAARKVLEHYVDEGERAQVRYALTRTIPSLRAREIAIVHRYQNLFRQHLSSTLATTHSSGLDTVGAEVMASSVVAATNHIIRRWLRSELDEPLDEFDIVAALLVSMDWSPWRAAERRLGGRATLVVIESDESASTVINRLRTAFPDARLPGTTTARGR